MHDSNITKCDPNALTFVDNYLNEIEYLHSFNRYKRDLAQYGRWKASQLRTFIVYVAMPVLVRLRLAMPHTFSEVYISHFPLIFIYIRVLRHFDDRDEILQVPVFIHVYLRLFSCLYDKCKELYSVHALCNLRQHVLDHGGLAYHRLIFIFKNCSFLIKMARYTTSITPGRTRKLPVGALNIQTPFIDDMDEFSADENEIDDNYPIIRNIPFHSQQQCESSVQRSYHNKNTNAYYTSQVKRKRLQVQVDDELQGSLMENFKIIQNMFKDLSQKVDILTERGSTFEKKIGQC
ncbi:unnamed protein product [Rotaria sordida]|uniref:Uncharacterized protein n=1 Tax=Rotaria sordida TaxID=392033 RepID=A0A815KTC7_9BILA|nr:unnamed protein product [Rotaria sordida]CAF1399858.1 unnamed protein product [Rotaria sordida]